MRLKKLAIRIIENLKNKKTNQNDRFAYDTTHNSISKLYLKTLYLKIGI